MCSLTSGASSARTHAARWSSRSRWGGSAPPSERLTPCGSTGMPRARSASNDAGRRSTWMLSAITSTKSTPGSRSTVRSISGRQPIPTPSGVTGGRSRAVVSATATTTSTATAAAAVGRRGRPAAAVPAAAVPAAYGTRAVAHVSGGAAGGPVLGPSAGGGGRTSGAPPRLGPHWRRRPGWWTPSRCSRSGICPCPAAPPLRRWYPPPRRSQPDRPATAGGSGGRRPV